MTRATESRFRLFARPIACDSLRMVRSAVLLTGIVLLVGISARFQFESIPFGPNNPRLEHQPAYELQMAPRRVGQDDSSWIRMRAVFDHQPSHSRAEPSPTNPFSP